MLSFTTLVGLASMVGNLLPVVPFLLMSVFPGYALIAAQHTPFSWYAVIFPWDTSLENRVLIEFDALSGIRTVGSLLRSGAFTVRQSVNPGSTIRVLATAYSSTASQTDTNPFRTASGHETTTGVLATNFLPLGTEVRINHRSYFVLDRMHSRYNGKYIVDIWMPSQEAALIFGARLVTMDVVSMP